MYFCEMYDETLEHLFADSMVVKTFWLRFIALMIVFHGFAYKINVKDILLGLELQDPANKSTPFVWKNVHSNIVI